MKPSLIFVFVLILAVMILAVFTGVLAAQSSSNSVGQVS